MMIPIANAMSTFSNYQLIMLLTSGQTEKDEAAILSSEEMNVITGHAEW